MICICTCTYDIKIEVKEKRRHDSISVKWIPVFFFCCRPSTSWPVVHKSQAFYHVWKWHNFQRARSEMRCCTTHALYWSELWQQDHCQHTQNANLDCHELQGHAQGDGNKVSGYSYGFWYGFKWGPHHAISHLRSRLESQHQSVPGCAEECGNPLVQSGGHWKTLGVAVGLGAGPQVQRDAGLASEGVLWLCTLH